MSADRPRSIALGQADASLREACAEILVEAFAETSPDSWPDLEAARDEVAEAMAPGNVGLVLVDQNGRALGWIAAAPIYTGHVWEIHPLAVRPEAQGGGLGRRLLEEIEALAAGAGVATLWLGSDDEVGATSLGGRDLYPDPLAALATMRNLRRHPYEFYLACGFSLVGVLPDANGPGKPDIFLAKRVRPSVRAPADPGLDR